MNFSLTYNFFCQSDFQGAENCPMHLFTMYTLSNEDFFHLPRL